MMYFGKNISSISMPTTINMSKYNIKYLPYNVKLCITSLPSTLKIIEYHAIAVSNTLKDITFDGTKSSWRNITKDDEWAYCSSGPIIVNIICKDGTVSYSVTSSNKIEEVS